MKQIRDVKDFFIKDPMGQKFLALGKQLMDVMQMTKIRMRGAMRKYLKKLLKKDDDDDDDIDKGKDKD